MENKFSSYDIIAHIVPGGFLWIMLSFYPYFNLDKLIKVQGDNTRLAIYLMLFLSIGLIVQYLSGIIEFIIKQRVWGGRMFSEVFLIKQFCKLTRDTRCKILEIIGRLFDRSVEKMEKDLSDANNFDQAAELCLEIYHEVEAYTLKKGLANKVSSYYEGYGLFRGMCFDCAFLAIIFSFLLVFHHGYVVLFNWIYVLVFILLTVAFYDRARDRGERYVNGLLYSLMDEYSSNKSGKNNVVVSPNLVDSDAKLLN